MLSILKFWAIYLIAQCAIANAIAIEKRDTSNVTLKAPIIATPSEHWEGVDGTWSTFEIRVGTPAQTFRVLPATSWQETWVVYGAAAGVCNTTLGVAANCQDERGGVYDPTTSSTWEVENQDSLGLNIALGYDGVGQYGFDTVGLGYTNTTGLTLTHQIVAAIVSDTWWFGQLGLGFQPTNFTTYGNPQASFADTLWSNDSISSMSWSYTAGAYYRLKSIFGNLIFGGYDASRFAPNDLIFTMTGDNLRDIVVTIRSITSTTASGNTTLMSEPEFAFIDSTVPEIWLPADVCQQFEKAFGLVLDNSTGLYLLNNSQQTQFQQLNPNITFTLGDQKTGGITIDIVLPYSSFVLNATSPFLTNKSSFYFPIKQAPDDTQYTLGRTFLQEAYVTTHYNSRTFNVSQCIFDDSAPPHVLALPSILPTPTTTTSPTSSSSSSPKSHKGLKGGAIAGIVIGVIVVLLLFALIFFLFRRRTNRPSQRPSTPTAEIDTGRRIEHPDSSAYSGQASAFTSEVSGKDAKFEIQGNPIMHPQELEAVPLSPVTERERTPMAELEVGERGLGYGAERDGEEVGVRGGRRGVRDTISTMSPGGFDGMEEGEEGWSPSTSSTLERRKSRFEERFGEGG